jgi:hypothetical protein
LLITTVLNQRIQTKFSFDSIEQAGEAVKADGYLPSRGLALTAKRAARTRYI